MAKVSKDISGCWLWLGAVDAAGYGDFWFGGTNVGAHRVAWTLFMGEIPAGRFVCHHCDRPPCVNPAHLFVGTHGDNMRDASQKGRLDTQTALRVRWGGRLGASLGERS